MSRLLFIGHNKSYNFLDHNHFDASIFFNQTDNSRAALFTANTSLDETLTINTLRIVLSSTAIVFNSIVLYLIAKFQTLRKNPCNCLIAFLAFADVAFCIGLLFKGATTIIHHHWPLIFDYNKLNCLLISTPCVISGHAIPLITALIAVDRFLAVNKPLNYGKSNNTRMICVCIVTTGLWAVTGTAMAFIGVPFDEKTAICAFGSCATKTYSYYWLSYSVILAILMSFTYITSFYRFKYKLSNYHHQQQQTESAEKRALKRQTSMFVTINLVLASYALFWFAPAVIIAIVSITVSNSLSAILLGELTVLLGLLSALNAIVNAIIYGWKHRQLRQCLMTSLGGTRQNSTTVDNHKRNTSTVGANIAVCLEYTTFIAESVDSGLSRLLTNSHYSWNKSLSTTTTTTTDNGVRSTSVVKQEQTEIDDDNNNNDDDEIFL